MVYLSPLQSLMEDNNYGYFDRNIGCDSNNSNFCPEIIDNTDKLSCSNTTHDPKIETQLEDATNMFKYINHSENIVYILDDFSSNFTDSYSKGTPQTISFSSESLQLCDQSNYTNSTYYTAPLPIIDSSFSINRSVGLNNNPCELKKLLKVDVLSPDSFGSSYQSINEDLSIDSSQSNQTMNSTAQSNQSELCVICNDFATGKHYGVSACEGCKGFFKRTIRKNLSYSCRDRNLCPITERLRNRCQSCRFNKCLEKGMKIEAVQKERTLKQKLRPPETSVNQSIPTIKAEDILENEMSFYCVERSTSDSSKSVDVDQTKLFCTVVNKQLFNLVRWAKSVPGFSALERSDQIILLNRSWVELLIASFSFQSSIEPEFGYIKMDETHRLSLSMAADLGMQHLMIRILRELIITLKHLQVDQMEMACLKAIIVFDSNYANLKNAELIKQIRFCIFDILKNYVSHKYPRQPYRIYKLLLKLPSFRGLTTCFIEKMKTILFDDLPMDNFPQSPVDQANNEDIENQSKPDLLYPLFSEMMKQKDYPYL